MYIKYVSLNLFYILIIIIRGYVESGFIQIFRSGSKLLLTF